MPLTPSLRRRIGLLVALVVGSFVLALPGWAHVTVNPREGDAGSFARFAIRVPNERDGAATVKLDLELPKGLAFVSFEVVPGWTRETVSEPIPEAERGKPAEPGEKPPTTRTARVSWTGGKIGPGEFLEFGMSAKLPDAEGDLVFKALQSYDSGEIVRWISDDPKADTPAPRVRVTRKATAGPACSAASGSAGSGPATAPAGSSNATAALIVAIGAAILAVAALALGLGRRPRRTP